MPWPPVKYCGQVGDVACGFTCPFIYSPKWWLCTSSFGLLLCLAITRKVFLNYACSLLLNIAVNLRQKSMPADPKHGRDVQHARLQGDWATPVWMNFFNSGSVHSIKGDEASWQLIYVPCIQHETDKISAPGLENFVLLLAGPEARIILAK